jgi:hypothetical protein
MHRVAIERTDEKTRMTVEAMVRFAGQEMRDARECGFKVVAIWDADGVAIGPRSDDVFRTCCSGLDQYYEYEARLLASDPERTPWTSLIEQLHNFGIVSHVVTARAGTPMLRLQHFLATRIPDLQVILGVGSQCKGSSYQMLLEEVAGTDTMVFLIEDTQRHIEAFGLSARQLGVASRIRPFLTPIIREYSEAELRAHFHAVMHAFGTDPVLVPHEHPLHRPFLVLPEGKSTYARELFLFHEQLRSRAVRP